MFGDVLVQRWHWKKSRFERLSPLPESPVSRNRSGSVVWTWAPQGRHSRGTIYLMLEEMLVKIIKSENRTTRVCLQKNGKEKSARPSRVIFEAGSVCGLCIATEHSPDLQKSIQTKQAHHLQNRNRNQTRVHLIVFLFTLLLVKLKKKKKRLLKFWALEKRLSGEEQEGLSLIAVGVVE